MNLGYPLPAKVGPFLQEKWDLTRRMGWRLVEMVNTKSIIVSILVLLGASWGLSQILGLTESQRAQDVEEIKRVIVLSAELEQKLPVLPEPYRSSDVLIPDEVRDMVNQQIISRLSEVFSANSGLLASRIGVLQKSTWEQEDTGFRWEDGGVRSANFISIDFPSSEQAIVIVDIRKWARVTQIKPEIKTATPENTMRLTYALAKEGNKWKITGLSGKFLPGEEP